MLWRESRTLVIIRLSGAKFGNAACVSRFDVVLWNCVWFDKCKIFRFPFSVIIAPILEVRHINCTSRSVLTARERMSFCQQNYCECTEQFIWYLSIYLPTVDFNSPPAFKRTVKRADLSAFLLCNCTWCVLFIAFMFLYGIFFLMLAQFGAILLFYTHLSVQEFLPWCSSCMSEINWNWNWAVAKQLSNCLLGVWVILLA